MGQQQKTQAKIIVLSISKIVSFAAYKTIFPIAEALRDDPSDRWVSLFYNLVLRVSRGREDERPWERGCLFYSFFWKAPFNPFIPKRNIFLQNIQKQTAPNESIVIWMLTHAAAHYIVAAPAPDKTLSRARGYSLPPFFPAVAGYHSNDPKQHEDTRLESFCFALRDKKFRLLKFDCCIGQPYTTMNTNLCKTQLRMPRVNNA